MAPAVPGLDVVGAVVQLDDLLRRLKDVVVEVGQTVFLFLFGGFYVLLALPWLLRCGFSRSALHHCWCWLAKRFFWFEARSRYRGSTPACPAHLVGFRTFSLLAWRCPCSEAVAFLLTGLRRRARIGRFFLADALRPFAWGGPPSEDGVETGRTRFPAFHIGRVLRCLARDCLPFGSEDEAKMAEVETVEHFDMPLMTGPCFAPVK